MDYRASRHAGRHRKGRTNRKRLAIQSFFAILVLILIWNYCYNVEYAPALRASALETSVSDAQLVEGAVVDEKDEEILQEDEKVPVKIVPVEDETDAAFAVTSEDEELMRRRNMIRGSFLRAYKSYERYAFGHDELKPVSKGVDDSWGGLGLTILDGMDTLLLMDLEEEYTNARDFVAELDFAKDYNASFFETTIRHLGGLLSCFTITEDSIFLEKALDLAERLAFAFDRETKIPHSIVNLLTKEYKGHKWTDNSLLSEVGTFQLEFKYLTYLTGEEKYAELANHVDEMLEKARGRTSCGLPPLYFSPTDVQFHGDYVSVGAMGDSYYEYLLKSYILLGENVNLMHRFNSEIELILSHLIIEKKGQTYLTEWENGRVNYKMDHLSCFFPGLLALGSTYQNESQGRLYLDVAKRLCHTCYRFYSDTKTGLGPEIVSTNEAGRRDYYIMDPANHLRPETVESIFYLWRTTHDKMYREWGWKIYEAIERHARTESAYSGIRHVNADAVMHDDSLPTFFFSETMKYLFMLFSDDDVIPLGNYVLSTEGHPFAISK